MPIPADISLDLDPDRADCPSPITQHFLEEWLELAQLGRHRGIRSE